jgi:hypothetical protein
LNLNVWLAQLATNDSWQRVPKNPGLHTHLQGLELLPVLPLALQGAQVSQWVPLEPYLQMQVLPSCDADPPF